MCTASVAFIEANAAILPKQGSTFADEGTLAHSIASDLLLNKGSAAADPTMDVHCHDYARFVRDKVGPNDRLLVERKVPLFYLPSQRGTVDAAIIGTGIYIADFKYGVGVSVQAKENKQLAIYAESLIQQLEKVDEFPDDTLVTLAIFQPRDRNDPNPVRLWALTRGELRVFCFAIDEKARLILSGGPVEFVADPQEQCFFCPASGICKAYAEHGLRGIEVLANDAPVDEAKIATFPDPTSLSREQRVKIIKHRKGLEKWLEAVEAQEIAELMMNAPRHGLKLVEGKSNRQWRDEKAAKTLLSNHLTAAEITPPGDIISPAAAEKALKGKELSTRFENAFTALIEKPVGKPTLVPEEDKRIALVFDLTQQFQNLDAQKGADLI